MRDGLIFRAVIAARTLFTLIVLLASPPLFAQETNLQSAQLLEAEFQIGLAALQRGETAEAIRRFRSVLAVEPAAARVRLELARAYFIAQDWALSRATFFEVLSAGVPAGVRETVLAFIRAIDARRGWNWDLQVGFQPRLFSGKRYHSDTVELEFGGATLPFTLVRREPPPFIVSADLSAEARQSLGFNIGTASMAGFVDGLLSIDDSPGTLDDDIQGMTRLGVRALMPNTTSFLALSGQARRYGGRRLEEQVSLISGAEHRSIGGTSIFFSGSAGRVTNTVSDRSGYRFSGRGGVAQSFGGRGFVGVAVSAERLDAEATFESFVEWRGEGFGQVDLRGGYQLKTTTYYLEQRFDSEAPFFSEIRRDSEVGLSFRALNRNWYFFGIFSPFAEVGFSRRTSNIDAFGYDEIKLTFGIERGI